MRLVVVCAVAACRFGFEPVGDARTTGGEKAVLDAPVDAARDAAAAQLGGTYTVAPPIAYNCALDIVDIGVTQFTFTTGGTTLTVTSNDVGAPQEPCTMLGTAPLGNTFSVTCTLPGACAEHYTLAGTTAGSGWTGTFTATFTPAGNCVDCTTQMFAVTGTP